MDTNTRQMRSTIQNMLRAAGYSTVVTNDRGEWVVMVLGLVNFGTMRLFYPDDKVTPAEVVFSVRDLLDKINGK
jgi:hypothetical protein